VSENIPNFLKKQALPTDDKMRKGVPLCTGVLDYFPDALVDVALLSKAGNDQHNPGQPLHWSKHKSTDHANCLLRHQADRGTRDTDGIRHSTKVAWRALAQLQTEIEAERAGLTVRDYIARLQREAGEGPQPAAVPADASVAMLDLSKIMFPSGNSTGGCG
jgi:hypothetical protein